MGGPGFSDPDCNTAHIISTKCVLDRNFKKSNTCLLSLDLGDPSDFGRPYRKKNAVGFSKIFKTVSNDQKLPADHVSIHQMIEPEKSSILAVSVPKIHEIGTPRIFRA